VIQQKVLETKQFDALKKIVVKVDASKVFLLRGGKSFQKSGAEEFIRKLLPDQRFTSFFEFEPNPQLEDLKKGVALFNSGNFELIIAIGGGSVLDMAKLISVFAHQETDFEEIIQGKAKLTANKTPVLTIPTTAGSGAEATRFAVVYIGKQKYSVYHELMLPDTVYLDPAFLTTASPYLTACAGLDAFCQAIESVWSVNANDESQNYALEAISLIWRNLKKAVLENDAAAKGHMQQASYLAGKAINITKTTAPHALSYAFTSYYGIPHGHAVALSLPFFMEYNYQLNENNCTDPRGVDAVKGRIDKMLDLLGLHISEVKSALAHFFEILGVNTRIWTLIKNFDPNIIIDNVNVERLSNNPRQVSKTDIAGFLKF
jgi:alcohol dehydrogenase class IV